MARATVLKRFELSPEEADWLEMMARASGQSQTGFVRELIRTAYAGHEYPGVREVGSQGSNTFTVNAGAVARTPASPDMPRYTIACDGCPNVWHSYEAFPQACPQCGKEITPASPDVQRDSKAICVLCNQPIHPDTAATLGDSPAHEGCVYDAYERGEKASAGLNDPAREKRKPRYDNPSTPRKRKAAKAESVGS